MNPRFRVWNLYDQEMAYPSTDAAGHRYALTLDGQVFAVSSLKPDFWAALAYRSAAVVMLSTGFVDANGKEIFEGDVLNLISGASSSHRLHVYVEYDHAQAGFPLFCTDSKYGYLNSELWEIIGNRFENPELWQKAKNR